MRECKIVVSSYEIVKIEKGCFMIDAKTQRWSCRKTEDGRCTFVNCPMIKVAKVNKSVI